MVKQFFLILGVAAFAACSSDSSSSDKKTPVKQSDTSKKVMSGMEQMINQHPDGDYIEKYPNGVIKIRGYILRGMREGQWSSFYQSGPQWSECIYEKGKRNGPTTSWYESGKKRYTGFYTNDKPSGKWIFWDEQGNKANEVDEGDGNSGKQSGEPGT